MPPTKSTLRIGEGLQIEAQPFDLLDEPTAVELPGWELLSGVSPIISLADLASPEPPYEAVVSGLGPGVETVVFFGRDAFDNEIRVEDTITVLNASALLFRTSDAVNCRVVQEPDRIVVYNDVSPPADPAFLLTIIPVDSRGNERRGMPAYTLLDGPNVSTNNNLIVLNGGNTSSDDTSVNVTLTARGESIITATAVNSQGQTIVASIPILVNTGTRAVVTESPA